MGWRDVPVGPQAVGPLARHVMPRIRQFFIENKVGNEKAFERKLYVTRRRFESTAEDLCYVFTGRRTVSSVHLPIEQEHAYLWTKTECLHTAKLIRRALLKRRAPA